MSSLQNIAYRVTESIREHSDPSLYHFPISSKDYQEVLSFLRCRPVHTVHLESLIRDNGVNSSINRGMYYGCRDSKGTLQGVALIGHSTIMETRSPAAVRLFADLARDHSNIHLVMGEVARMEEFWPAYSIRHVPPRLTRRELLYECKATAEMSTPVEGMRRATQKDLARIVELQAELALAESGINPLNRDSEGFAARCAYRVNKGRVWVLEQNGELLFKADVQSLSENIAYLEGIWVDPRRRRTGLGSRALSHVTQELLTSVGSVCLFADQSKSAVHAVYRRAGFKLAGIYDAVFPL